MNGEALILVPPSAPTGGLHLEMPPHGIRQEDVYDKRDGNLVSEGERGIGGVRTA